MVSINGDGDFLMNGQEFATAVQYKLPIIVLVFDNALYGTIRMHQEREYPGRVIATDLVNPDFAAYARSFGGFGARWRRPEDFAPAFRAAEASGLPSIIHVKFDAEGITPVTTLSAIRAQAKASDPYMLIWSGRSPNRACGPGDRPGPTCISRSSMRVMGATLLKLPGGENLVRAQEILVRQRLFDHRDAVVAQQADHPRPGDAGQEGAVGRRREDHAVLHHEDIGIGQLGDIAQHVAEQAIVEAARRRFQQAHDHCWDRDSSPWPPPARFPSSGGDAATG